MDSLLADFRGMVDQLNPLSRQNQILYVIWLFGYFFLMAGVWRASRRWIRLCFLIIHQIFSAGVLISQVNIIVLAVLLWRESLAIIIVAIILAIVLFRQRRSNRQKALPEDDMLELNDRAGLPQSNPDRVGPSRSERLALK